MPSYQSLLKGKTTPQQSAAKMMAEAAKLSAMGWGEFIPPETENTT